MSGRVGVGVGLEVQLVLERGVPERRAAVRGEEVVVVVVGSWYLCVLASFIRFIAFLSYCWVPSPLTWPSCSR